MIVVYVIQASVEIVAFVMEVFVEVVRFQHLVETHESSWVSR